MDAGYVVVDTWRVKPGKEGETAAALVAMRRRFRAVPGIVSVDFARIDDDPARYLVVFRYRDAAARAAFVATLWDLDTVALRATTLPDG